MARHGGTLQDLFKVYRSARRGVWEYVADGIRAQGAGADSLELLVFLWDRASHWIDSMVESSAVLFEDERDQVRQGAAAQRLETVREILDGRTSSANPRELSEALNGYPISGFNTALVLSAADADRVSELRPVTLPLARSARVRHEGRDLWVWLGTSKQP